jgi:hypothetical protein
VASSLYVFGCLYLSTDKWRKGDGIACSVSIKERKKVRMEMDGRLWFYIELRIGASMLRYNTIH